MKLKFLVEEDFINYKVCSMFLGFPNCSYKCNIDAGCVVCQNYELKGVPDIEITADEICEKYFSNNLSHAIVIGGCEPFDSPFDLTQLINTIRNKYNCNDPIIIYTGYKKAELQGLVQGEYPGVNYDKLAAAYNQLQSFNNIILKYGRFIPGHTPHEDHILGVSLASDNQYAEIINGSLDN